MKQQEQKLHMVMDESDAPYEDDEYTMTLEDDLICLRVAEKYGLEFTPGSHLDQISKMMDKAPGCRFLPMGNHCAMDKNRLLNTIMDAIETKDYDPLELTWDIPGYNRSIDILCTVSPFPVTLDNLPESPKGKTRYGACDHAGGRIIIDWCLPGSQTVRALLHEIAHAVLHPWPDGKKPEHWDDTLRSREVQAETVAFAVCRNYGLDASTYSIPYIAGWARKLSVPELEADIDIALRTARDLITAIDAEILKRRPDGPD